MKQPEPCPVDLALDLVERIMMMTAEELDEFIKLAEKAGVSLEP